MGAKKSSLSGGGAYEIRTYSKRKAEKLGVTIRPSSKPGKKIDVFDKKGNLLASIGAIGYKDYPTFYKFDGAAVAERRRRAYKLRHEKDRHRVGSPGYYADQILW